MLYEDGTRLFDKKTRFVVAETLNYYRESTVGILLSKVCLF